jgi:hypothetical protein
MRARELKETAKANEKNLEDGVISVEDFVEMSRWDCIR